MHASIAGPVDVEMSRLYHELLWWSSAEVTILRTRKPGRGSQTQKRSRQSRVLRDERGWPEDRNFLAGKCEIG